MTATVAGRALLARENEYGEFVPNIEADDIDAIEREAAAQERERIQRAVDALPYATSEEMRKVGKAIMAGKVRAILAEPSDD